MITLKPSDSWGADSTEGNLKGMGVSYLLRNHLNLSPSALASALSLLVHRPLCHHELLKC